MVVAQVYSTYQNWESQKKHRVYFGKVHFFVIFPLIIGFCRLAPLAPILHHDQYLYLDDPTEGISPDWADRG